MKTVLSAIPIAKARPKIRRRMHMAAGPVRVSVIMTVPMIMRVIVRMVVVVRMRVLIVTAHALSLSRIVRANLESLRSRQM